MHIVVINGPSLNMLGVREPEVYGRRSYDDLVAFLQAHAQACGIRVTVQQSNHEGALIDYIQAARETADGIVLNPGAYTHTSIALLDVVMAVGVPTVEVHLSDTDRREPFRKISYVRPACIASIRGKGFEGYKEAIDLLVRHTEQRGVR